MSICAGAEVVAATGLFDDHRTTAFHAQLDWLPAQYPAIRYQRDVRWVRDGAQISSDAFTAGIDATLAAIDTLAGRAAARRAAAAIAYPHLRFLDDPAYEGSPGRAMLALEM